jgi:hypothetical protein
VQICLNCARQEYQMGKAQCDCGGTLWIPRNVGGKQGNTDLDEATRLIRKGKKPWEKE